jgi:hypothetical protein
MDLQSHGVMVAIDATIARRAAVVAVIGCR